MNPIHPRHLPPASAPGEHFPFLCPWGCGGMDRDLSLAQPLLSGALDLLGLGLSVALSLQAPSLQCNHRGHTPGMLRKSSLHLPLRLPSPSLACFFPHLDSHLTPLVTATCLHRHQGQFWLPLPFPPVPPPLCSWPPRMSNLKTQRPSPSPSCSRGKRGGGWPKRARREDGGVQSSPFLQRERA